MGISVHSNSIGTLSEEKYQAKRNARQLGYLNAFPDLESRINNAKSVTEVHNLLTSARKAF